MKKVKVSSVIEDKEMYIGSGREIKNLYKNKDYSR